MSDYKEWEGKDKLIAPRDEWEEKFWDLEEKYNLMLDNENYGDLMEFAKEYEQAGRAEERKHLIGVVESLRKNGHKMIPSLCRGCPYNQAVDDLLTHLRGEDQTRTWREVGHPESPSQEETECCEKCRGVYFLGKQGYPRIRCKTTDCPCHKPRTAFPPLEVSYTPLKDGVRRMEDVLDSKPRTEVSQGNGHFPPTHSLEKRLEKETKE